jgi:hypothetical protein
MEKKNKNYHNIKQFLKKREANQILNIYILITNKIKLLRYNKSNINKLSILLNNFFYFNI